MVRTAAGRIMHNTEEQSNRDKRYVHWKGRDDTETAALTRNRALSHDSSRQREIAIQKSNARLCEG